jgi:predicted TIM-barrel fold metal-dependent hydrolase
MPYPISLADTFRRIIECFGPDRVLFGSDSSYWPRGFRRDVFDEQLGALTEIGATDDVRRKFLGGNAARILRLDRDK